MDPAAPLCLLLLPCTLEDSAFEGRGRDLLRAPAVVAVEPGRVGAGRGGGALAAIQARRLTKKLEAQIAVVVVLDPAQYPLARALLARNPGSELWYAEHSDPATGGPELHRLAQERAALRFDPAPPGPGEAAHQRNDLLWSRLEELMIATR